ncbi:sensor histidine kinase [Tissierella pigra]|uniref:histidine kinase n=1 Tax=Tissierella pigra TaxID=2607614 RepID=A0A6N7Y2E0_9FIRM|nr:sensor histidine kinase [Tissierella pigra]MSU03014.1 HAMP domain-containing histidine kinase [Tissierella pigra]
MRFRDYLKDRLFYIIIYFLSNFLAIIIMMLDLIIRKERFHTANIIYAFVLSTIFLTVFLSIDFGRKRKFYNLISNKLDNDVELTDVFNIPDKISREYDLFKEVLISNYLKYISTLEKHKKSSETQNYFNNRWIHQMKTPVSVIKLILEDERDRDIDEYTRKNYESIGEEVEKLSHGLEMALYTLRVSNFELDFKVEDVSLFEILRSIINENKNAFIANSIYPKIISKEDKIVKSDKKWIKFVISQILSNSIKYSKVKDSNNKVIDIEVYDENNKTVLLIEDRGVGIPKQDLDRVFDPFFTGKNGRKYLESTGMGLYLVKDVCDKLGHGVSIESIEGEGTKSSIIFYHGKSIYDLTQ